MSLLLWLVISVLDVMVFQLAERHIGLKKYSAADFDLNFNVMSLPISYGSVVSALSALVNSEESIRVFKNNAYIPFKKYEYIYSPPFQGPIHVSIIASRFMFIYDTKNVTHGNFTSYCGHLPSLESVTYGVFLKTIPCPRFG